jgi:hypothetical protein
MLNLLLLIGLVIGLFNVVFIVGLCRAAKRADRCLEQHDPRLLGNHLHYRGEAAKGRLGVHGKQAVRP